MNPGIGERLHELHDRLSVEPLPEALEGASCGPAAKHLAHLAMRAAQAGGSEQDWRGWVHAHVPEASDKQLAEAVECMQSSGLWPWHRRLSPGG